MMGIRPADRVWQRFVRRGGPSTLDRITLAQPLLVGAGMAVAVGVLYLLVGRVLLASQIDGARAVGAVMYGLVFSAVWLTLARRTLGEAIQRWDDQAAGDRPVPGGTVESDPDAG